VVVPARPPSFEKVATLNRWRQTALRASLSVESGRLLQFIDEAKSRLGV
jgi:hypothetical protein